MDLGIALAVVMGQISIDELNRSSFAVIRVAAARRAPGPYHGEDPNGKDPNGDDPHDEQHDPGLPANRHERDGYPSKDPYGGTTPNNRDEPYKPYGTLAMHTCRVQSGFSIN